MSALALVFDAGLALLLPFLAWRALGVRSLFAGVVLYIVFGALLAIVWLRLGAVDVALAEAAIGAGMTGVLLLGALADMARSERRGTADAPAVADAAHEDGAP